MKYPGIGRLGGYAEEVAAALRRRRDVRRPRVRVRIAHGEPRVLEDDAPEAQRLLGARARAGRRPGRTVGGRR